MVTLEEMMHRHEASTRDPALLTTPVFIEAAVAREDLVADAADREAPRFMTQRMRIEEIEAQEHERTQQLLALHSLVAPASSVFLLRKDARNPSPNICLGRAKMNDVVIVDTTISSLHAVIDKRGALYYLRDHRSKNGTYINRERLTGTQEAMLQSGDCVRLGRRVFYYLSGDRFAQFLQMREAVPAETEL